MPLIEIVIFWSACITEFGRVALGDGFAADAAAAAAVGGGRGAATGRVAGEGGLTSGRTLAAETLPPPPAVSFDGGVDAWQCVGESCGSAVSCCWEVAAGATTDSLFDSCRDEPRKMAAKRWLQQRCSTTAAGVKATRRSELLG